MSFSSSHLLSVAGIMTRVLADTDDMVTETTWWFPINNVDGMGRSVEQDGADRRKREGEIERLRQGGEKAEEKGKQKMNLNCSASPSQTRWECNQIHWQSVPEASYLSWKSKWTQQDGYLEGTQSTGSNRRQCGNHQWYSRIARLERTLDPSKVIQLSKVGIRLETKFPNSKALSNTTHYSQASLDLTPLHHSPHAPL